ncbi:ABC transporter substrate-binding protein [Desulfurobacterium sp.]
MKTLLIILFLTLTASAQTFTRVISLSPAITEIVYFTGNGEKLIADTRYCTIPEEAKKKEKIGGIINPDIEKIISLRPDLVIGMNGNPKFIIETLKKFDITVITFKIEKIEDIAKAIKEIGDTLSNNGNKKAKEFLKNYKQAEKKLSHCIKGKRILIIFSTNPIYTAGNQTFLGEIIEDAKAINIAGNGRYKTISPEFILKHKPDLTIFISMTKNNNSLLNFLKTKTIHISGKYLLKPGPYIIKGIKELEEKICQEN